jgi:hypothetical protein
MTSDSESELENNNSRCNNNISIYLFDTCYALPQSQSPGLASPSGTAIVAGYCTSVVPCHSLQLRGKSNLKVMYQPI